MVLGKVFSNCSTGWATLWACFRATANSRQEDVPPIIGFVWRSIDASILTIKVHDGTLCFEGAGEERSWLAEMVEFLLADGRESTGLHVEHYPGHPALSENSAPLVLALTSQTH